VPVFPLGVGSNLIVRDGGLRGVAVRLGRPFADIDIDGRRVRAGAAALDAQVAKKAADSGIDLTFLRTIPGAIGGALRMNAGCYGTYVADVLTSAAVMHRDGKCEVLKADDLEFAYRSSSLAPDAIVINATFVGELGDPDELHRKMTDQLARRDETQPTNDRTAGSTFRNPAGYSSTGQADDTHELKAWKVIEDAGMRGATLGGAQMSAKHPNFLTNTGQATAYELESLGEQVRKRVFVHSGLRLEWEIMRVGDPGPEGPVEDGLKPEN
jgi:UDP-N-acetylmuramate dehydrogenase